VIIQKSTTVLQSGTPGFEYKRSDMSSHIYFAGPLLPYSKKRQNSPWYDSKLGQYEKVILVTQGTVERDVEKLIVPTLEAFRISDYLVIVTTGGSQTRELREKYPEPNFIIEDFIPFDDVMPYADVYITNGGYGGVLLSIQNQLPMVAAGVHEGKNEINARIGYFKLGVNLKTELPKPYQLKVAVEKILKDPVYASNVKNLSTEFNTYKANIICEAQVAKLTGRKQGAAVGRIQESELIY
ncbi:MAG: glycosyltransferase, partial [Flavisolibacter sp.]